MSRKTSGSKKSGLKSQVLLAMGSVLFLFALALGFFFYAAAIMPGQGPGAVTSGLASMQDSYQLQNTLAEAQQIANMFFLTNDPALAKKHKATASKLVNQATKFKQVATKRGSQKEAAAANKIVTQSQSYMNSFQQLAQISINQGDTNSGLRGQLNTAAQTFYGIVQRNEVSDLALAAIELLVQQKEYLRNNRGASLQNLISAKKKLERIARETKIDTLEAQLLRKSIRNYSAALDRYQAVSLATNDPNLSSTLGKEQSRQTEAVRNAGGEIQSIIARVNVPSASTLAADIRNSEANFLLFIDDKYVTQFGEGLDALVKAFRTSSILQEDKNEIIKASAAYRQAFTSLVANEKKTKELATSFTKNSSSLSASIAAFGKAQGPANKSAGFSFTSGSNLFVIIAVMAGLVTILIGFIVALFLGNSIANPLKSITQILQRIINDKDFSVEIPVTSKNEIGALAKELNNLLALQAENTYQASDSTESLAVNLEELSELATSLNNSINDLVEDNERLTQAASVHDEVETEVEEILSRIKTAGESIAETQEGIVATDQEEPPPGTIEEFTQSLESTFTAIQDITNASSQIEDIINQGADLAEKTNLLALNASVKAARAGSHGREFSALADEIAQLAQRSEELSKEAKQISETMSEKINQSASLGDNVKNTLDKVVAGSHIHETASGDFKTDLETILTSTDVLGRIIDKLSLTIQEVVSIAQEQVEECKTAQASVASLLEKTSDRDEQDTDTFTENNAGEDGQEEYSEQDEISPSDDEKPDTNN